MPPPFIFYLKDYEILIKIFIPRFSYMLVYGIM